MRVVLSVLLIGIVLALSACTVPISVPEARQTAVAGGCWPYAVPQPLPTAPARNRPTSPVAPSPNPHVPTPTFGPSRTPVPTQVVYPICTPAPRTPTLTPPPPSPLPPIVPQTPQPIWPALRDAVELGDPAGMIDWRGIHSAYNAQTGGVVVAYITFAWSPHRYADGLVWVRVQDRQGNWADAQTVNPQPVTQFYGGVRVAVAPTGTIWVTYGSGDPRTAAPLWLVKSEDAGATWSTPVAVGIEGRVIDFDIDSQGGMHYLVSTPEVFYGTATYGYRAPGATTWQWTPLGGRPVAGDMALLEQDGRIVRFILATSDRPPSLVVLRSTDGRQWTPLPVDYDTWLPGQWPVMRPCIIAVPRGAGLIAAIWGTYGTTGVYAAMSLDGGETWTPGEQIAQHASDGAISRAWDYGTDPAIVYDVVSDRLAASWIEVETDGGDIFPVPVRTYLAVRDLDAPPGAAWQHAIVPSNVGRFTPPRLSDQRSTLWGTADGQHHWMVSLDDRNYQFRLRFQHVWMPALLDLGQS